MNRFFKVFLVIVITGSASAQSAMLTEFSVGSISAGPLKSKDEAEKVAWQYFGMFDGGCGLLSFKEEGADVWVFSTVVGDAARPAEDIVVRKDGSMISQGALLPVVRLNSGRWIYDESLNPFRKSRKQMMEFEKEKKANQALQHNDPSCHESCLRTPRASRGRG